MVHDYVAMGNKNRYVLALCMISVMVSGRCLIAGGMAGFYVYACWACAKP